MGIELFVCAILAFAPFALWGALCALNAMRWRETRRSVAAAFLMIAWGWGAVTFAAVDYLAHGSPLFWPRLMLFGVAMLAAANALLHFVNRRDCRCTGCPGRKAYRERRGDLGEASEHIGRFPS